MSFGWVITFITAVVAICAIMAAFGFRGRITTVGIDLGTTFSVVGFSKNGKVVIVEDSEGHRIFPSIVAYQENGDILAGYQAYPYMSRSPGSTIFNAKRFIGKSLKDEDDFHTYAAAHPFKVVEINSSKISNYSKVGFEIPMQPGVGSSTVDNPYITVAPEAVGTQVLKHLLEITASFLGHRQVRNAVIAVPAKFDSVQRQATGAAFKAAGLKIVRVLEEPTAAAVAYKLHKKKNIHHILVYDFGGGTLDVSLLYVSKGSVQVYATDGDDMLGGSDLDLCLYDIVKSKVEVFMKKPVLSMKEYLQQHSTSNAQQSSKSTSSPSDKTKHNNEEENNEWDANINANTATTSNKPKNPTGSSKNHPSADNLNYLQNGMKISDLCVSNNLRNKAESIKKQLTYNESFTMTCVYPNHDIKKEGNSNDQMSELRKTDDPSFSEIAFTVTVDEFENGCQILFDRCMLPVKRLLTDLEMTKEEVDEVVLVGGSTRIPKVKRMLREYFDKELNDHIDPDVTVAYGAASIND